MWADGAIHSSLDASQLLYLTIAYDWFLFGHDLKDRISKGEEIFFFCFYFLKFMMNDEFAVGRRRHVSGESFASDKVDGVDSLSSAGSSNSLNSCSSKSSRCNQQPFTKINKIGLETGENCNVNQTWPYDFFSGGNDFDISFNKSNHSSSHSSRGGWGRSSLRENENESKFKGSNGKNSNNCSPNSLSANMCSELHKGVSNGSLADSEKLAESVAWHKNGQSESSSESFGSLSDGGASPIVNASCGSTSSPVAVPSARMRKDSSNSVGSWQLVSGTGSLKGSAGSYFPSGTSSNSRTSRCS